MSTSQGNIRHVWIALTILSALFMFLPLHIQFIGEESVYAVYLQKMLQSGDLINIFYRPPLFLWAGDLLYGWLHFLPIELPLRIVSILFSIGSAGVAALFAHKVFRDKNAAVLAALVFLTLGEIQFWYGWLGYADAMFLFFIFSSGVSVWLAAQSRSVFWYGLAVLLINGAFLTKAITAYAFFFSTLAVVAYGFHSWRFFFRPINVLLSLAAFSAPIFWMQMHGSGADASFASLVHDIAMRFREVSPLKYLGHLVTIPALFVERMAPVSLVVLWFVAKRKGYFPDKDIDLILWILLINFIPYWVAPFSGMRHVMPLYGWASLVLTYWLLKLDFNARKAASVAIVIVLFLKIPFSFWALPVFKGDRRHGEMTFRAIAADVLHYTRGMAPIRQKNVTFVGFSVVAYINEIRKGQPCIRFLRRGEHGVYVLAYTPMKHASLIKKYAPFNSPLYLLYLE